MDEVKDNGAIENLADSQPTEVQEPKVAPDVAAENKLAEERQERNWKAIRQRKDELEADNRRKDEMIAKLLERKFESSSQPQAIDEPEEPDNEYIDKGKIKKVTKKEIAPLERKIQELEEKLNKRQHQDLISSLRSRYADFDDVVNSETLSILENEEPELAEAIAASKDPYKVGLQSYKYIKKLGLIQTAKDNQKARQTEKAIEKSEKANPSPQVYDKRPMAQAFRMTEDMQKELYNEMLQSASLAGSVQEMR